jgi:ABC-type uncharacterized transport system ATPase subunit
VLQLKDIRTGYGRIEVLHGIDLSVAPGEIVTIVGANGAGKSTLLRPSPAWCLFGKALSSWRAGLFPDWESRP